MLRQENHDVTELRSALPVTTDDLDALRYASERGLFLVTCNRDDFLTLVANHPNPGLIVLIRRRSRLAECGRLLALLEKSGEDGLRGNINYA